MWLIDLLDIVVKRRRFIFAFVASATAVAIVVSLILPKTYRARTTILPPESGGDLGGMLGLSAGQIAQAVTNFALPMMATPSDLYASMVESNRLLGAVVDSLGLEEVYGLPTRAEAIGKLRDAIDATVEPEGIIKIECEAYNATLSAEIANLIVANLNEVATKIQNSRGRSFRQFIERRLVEADSSLILAQRDFKAFQEENRVFAIDLQSEAVIRNLAEQKAALTKAEIELELAKTTLMPGHPEILAKEILISKIKSKLEAIDGSVRSSHDSVLTALDIPLTRIPDLSLRYAVLRRNLKIHELTYEMLYQQLEVAKLQERRDTPSLAVLDVATPPDAAIRPRKKLIAIFTFVFSGILAVAAATVTERLRNSTAANDQGINHLRRIWDEIRRRPL